MAKRDYVIITFTHTPSTLTQVYISKASQSKYSYSSGDIQGVEGELVGIKLLRVPLANYCHPLNYSYSRSVTRAG
jgi:hypothetical protein